MGLLAPAPEASKAQMLSTQGGALPPVPPASLDARSPSQSAFPKDPRTVIFRHWKDEGE